MDDPPTQNGDEAAPATAAHSADFTGTTTPARTAAPAEAAAPAETPSPAQATEAAIPPHSDGVLYPSRLPAFHRVPATGDIAAFVRWFWISEWDIGPRRTSRQHIIGYPASNLVVSNDRTEFSGPTTRASHRDLSGSGWAVGALLQPAAIPLVLNRVTLDRASAAGPTDDASGADPKGEMSTGGTAHEVSTDGPARRMATGEPTPEPSTGRPACEVRTRGLTRESSTASDGIAALRDTVQQVPLPELEAGIHAAMSSSAPPADRRAEAVRAFSAWLSACLGEPTADGLLANQMTEAAETQHQIVTVAGLAADLHVSQRTLQRLSATYVGLSPGMLIRRRRVQDGARRLREQPDLSLTDLAHELGYADHAHLTHDWRTVLGITPAGYRRDTAPDGPPHTSPLKRSPES